jgi:hypothetical protein
MSVDIAAIETKAKAIQADIADIRNTLKGSSMAETDAL